MPGNFYEGTWDSKDEFPGWGNNGLGSDFTVDRVVAPLSPAHKPWLGGCGRVRTTWTVGAGTFSFRVVPPNHDTPGRKLRASWAMLWRGSYVNFSGSRLGPVRVTARDDASGALGEVFSLTVITAGATPASGTANLYAYNALNGTFSTNHFDLNRFMNEWLVFDLYLESTGSAAPYTTKCYFDVWVRRGGRLVFLTRLALADYSGAVHKFDEWRYGFTLLTKNVDGFEILLDEVRIDLGGGDVPLPRSPTRSFDSYQAHAQIRKWDRSLSAWVSAWELDRSAIEALTCSFLAYRVEDRCEITLKDPGRYSATKLQDIVDDLEKNANALYRLDVYAPDVTYQDPQYPSTWFADMIFWSGKLVRREPTRDQAARGFRLAAVGWTEHLRQLIVTKKDYYQRTLNYILTDTFAQVSAQWPGTISVVTRTRGADLRITPTRAGWDVATFEQVLADLASFGQFFFGVSVSGYPSFERQSNSEFRLVFFEPNAELDVDLPSAEGLGEEVGIFLDAANDRRVVELTTPCDDSGYANRWTVIGSELFFDFLSVLYVITGQYALDLFAFDAPDSAGITEFEGSLNGLELVIVDKAFRSINIRDAKTGELFPAGRIDDVPTALQRLDGEASYEIVLAQEVAGGSDYVIYDLGQIPMLDESSDIATVFLRYILRANGVRLQRLLKDAESDGATGRESIARIIEDDSVRGWQRAAMLALQSRWTERRNSERCEIKVHGWMRVPNGSRNQWDNLAAISFGSERVTLLGTTANGGDGFIYGADERPVGNARVYEIRACEMVLTEGGWEASWSLGSAPRDLESILHAVEPARRFANQPFKAKNLPPKPIDQFPRVT